MIVVEHPYTHKLLPHTHTVRGFGVFNISSKVIYYLILYDRWFIISRYLVDRLSPDELHLYQSMLSGFFKGSTSSSAVYSNSIYT